MGEYEDASSCEIEALAENLVDTWSRYGGLRDKAANGAEEGGKETRDGNRRARCICIPMLRYERGQRKTSTRAHSIEED